MSDSAAEENLPGIAVIAMAGRFPGAADIATFWRNLREGVESISRFEDQDLTHVEPRYLNHPNYVKAMGTLLDGDLFDANFFGVTPREAGIMNPQLRIFLEVVWELLERAGYNPETEGESIGLFAGAHRNGYEDGLRNQADLIDDVGEMSISVGNSPDHMTPRVSYLLNLRGPSVPIHTACSTSLVAVHIACQSLLNFECDMAIAGGTAIHTPLKTGYLYREGGTLSPDGRCRAFDASAKGTAPGSGVAAILLKRLDDALAAGDHIHAVIKGSAINNDGGQKIGYTAPSVAGQRRVIEEALAVAGVNPEEISYIEAHGTGTVLGDPIEIEALRQAFGMGEVADPHCAIGSLKTNIGHLSAAAGVAGLIKAALCIEHRTLVPSLHFEQPNPEIAFAGSPFFVSTQTQPWQAQTRYAGVSSFGIGGTNAHAILAEAPTTTPAGTDSIAQQRPCYLITLAARTEKALARKRADLAAFLRAGDTGSSIDPGALSFTLNAGRRDFEVRRAWVIERMAELPAILDGKEPGQLAESKLEPVFMFPGQGAYYEHLGRELYRYEPTFRDWIDRCDKLLHRLLGFEMREYMFQADHRAEKLKRASIWQPALFTVEYALAQMWMAWGLVPKAMIGHSIGEYVAATLAGVFSLENALQLVVERGRRTEALAGGAMLAVFCAESQLLEFIRESISLAAVNGPELCVLSGPAAEIHRLDADLKQRGLSTKLLDSKFAFHSPMMAPMEEPLVRLIATFELKPPEIPFISNVTGTWMSAEDASDPSYWTTHLRSAVRFNDGIETLFGEPGRVFLEVGPGKVLTNLINRHPGNRRPAITSMALAGDSDYAEVLAAAGKLWSAGLSLDWKGFYGDQSHRRLQLPTYPFDRVRFWAGQDDAGFAPQTKNADLLDIRKDLSQWFYVPGWKTSPMPRPATAPDPHSPGRWLIFANSDGFTSELLQVLRGSEDTVVVQRGTGFEHGEKDLFRINPGAPGDYRLLFEALKEARRIPDQVIYGWSLDTPSSAGIGGAEAGLGFRSLVLLAQAFGELESDKTIRLGILTRNLHALLGSKTGDPQSAALLGAAWVIPKEYPTITCRSIDLPGDSANGESSAGHLANAGQVVRWLCSEQAPALLALRDGLAFEPLWDGVELNAPTGNPLEVEAGGVILITNGLQEIGFALAEHLATQSGTAVALVDRAFTPPPEQWESWVQEQGSADLISRRIERLRAIESKGGGLRVLSGDVADPAAMGRIAKTINSELGPIRAVIHLDGSAGAGLIRGKNLTAGMAVFDRKVKEALVLSEVLENLEYLVFFAENPAEGGIGKLEQGAAFQVLAALARDLRSRPEPVPAFCIDWGPRQWNEMEQGEGMVDPTLQAQLDEKRRLFGMSTAECIEALTRILDSQLARVVVSTRDYQAVMDQQDQFTTSFFQNQMQPVNDKAGTHERPELATPYKAPGNDMQRLLAEVWQSYFDIEKIGIEDNFFELGGHSLLAVQLLSRINEIFSSKVTIGLLFESPTVAGMADMILKQQAEVAENEEMAALLSEIEGLSGTDLNNALEAELKPAN